MLSLEIFNLEFDDTEVKGKPDSTIFRENITGFYNVLRGILVSNRNGNIDYYEEEFGTELENYQFGFTILNFESETSRIGFT